MKQKTWFIGTVCAIVCCLLVFAIPTIYIDPFFHYHKPLDKYQYVINNQRYQNDGIVRHFEYDAIITGTSMTENFKTSECDALFGVNSIKVSFSGGSFKEFNNNLQRAFNNNKNIRMVVCSLDQYAIFYKKDELTSLYIYPTFITNINPFDDCNYVFNKTIFINNTWGGVVDYTKKGNTTTLFDDYSNWNKHYTFGAEYAEEGLLKRRESARAEKTPKITDETITRITDNVRQNWGDLADQHPQCTFYLFIPPYSICEWGIYDYNNAVQYRIGAMQIAIDELLQHENIKLYSFYTNHELICNLDNYKDPRHYGEWVNSDILRWMRNDEYRITKDNVKAHIAELRTFFGNYDYDSLLK